MQLSPRNLIIKNIGIISQDKSSLVKFVLSEKNVLLFGRCLWHKDLVCTFYGDDVKIRVIAAGVVPKDVKNSTLIDEEWGAWKSSGYEVVTPEEYRGIIKDALSIFEDEINELWSSVNLLSR
jgi:hypothetical protein